jgi:hypothetical protein
VNLRRLRRSVGRDFDADLTAIDPRYFEGHVGNPNAKLTIVVGVEDEDAERFQ